MSGARDVFARYGTAARLPVAGLVTAFLGAPIVWLLHLSLVYFLVTIECETRWDHAGLAIAVATVACAAASLGCGALAWRYRRRLVHDAGRDGPRQQRPAAPFLLVIGLAASALFTAVIVLEGLSPVWGALCAPADVGP